MGILIAIGQFILIFAGLYIILLCFNKFNYWFYTKISKKEFLKALKIFKEKNANEVIINTMTGIQTLEFKYVLYLGYINYMSFSYKQRIYLNILDLAKKNGCIVKKVTLDNYDYYITFMV